MYNVFAASSYLWAASVSWVFFRQGVFGRAAEGDLSAAALLLSLWPCAHADGLERAKSILTDFQRPLLLGRRRPVKPPARNGAAGSAKANSERRMRERAGRPESAAILPGELFIPAP
jgi:hypothetical protein